MNSSTLAPSARRLSWLCQIAAAFIMGQTLFFKFGAAPEPVFIFTTLGVEPWGRWAAGMSELIAVVLLLIPSLAAWGALLTIGIMAGALLAHLGPLGIVVLGDGGLLFGMGLATLAAAVVVLWLRRNAIFAFLGGLVGLRSR
jgi:hypothetical protein